MRKRRPVVWLIAALILMGLGVLAETWYSKVTTPTPLLQATALDMPRALPAFDLVDTKNQAFNQRRLLGHWTFLFFGFTYCESVCPVTLAELSALARKIANQKELPQPQVVLITLDPDRDDLVRLMQYVTGFYPSFLGARGSLEALQPLLKDLGVAHERIVTSQHVSHYTIEHSGAVMLINPKGQLVAFFTPPHHAADLAHDYKFLSSK